MTTTISSIPLLVIPRIGRTPWFIAYDERYDSVVISIRGTWSIQDCVTDGLAGMKMIIVGLEICVFFDVLYLDFLLYLVL